MRENLSAARAAELLMQKDNITLLCHRRPDGDTVGSAFALYYALKELGKEVRVLCADALPKQYDYLYGDYTPSRVLDWPVEYVVTVDVATAGMLGGLEEKYGHMVDLCIDHHPSNSDYAAQTCLWQEAGACAEPVAAVIKAIGLPVSGKIAECVYTGLVTDTGGFRFSNTSAGTLRLAAEIMESGVDTAAITDELSPRFYALEVRDRTTVCRDIWDGCGEDSLRGLFLQKMREKYDAAGEDERQTIQQAVRFALSAMENRDM